MSWGYFVDMTVSLPTAAYERIIKRKPAEYELHEGWSGLEDVSLERAFGRLVGADESFAKVLAWKVYKKRDGLLSIEQRDGMTRVRICLLCDKSTLELAYPLAAFFEAARQEDGAGLLRLVNDGTSSGEEGSALTLARHKIKKQRIDDCQAITEELVAEIHGLGAEEDAAPPEGKERVMMVNPFTGQPVTVWRPKKSAKKSASKKGPKR